MIIDGSALVAIITGEEGWENLRDAIAVVPGVIPAPTLVEFRSVAAGRGHRHAGLGERLILELLADGIAVAPFEHRHAEIAAIARVRYGKGNGCGGLLNFGDLMVYAVAKDRGEPILCTGRDVATTDLALHPSSRIDR